MVEQLSRCAVRCSELVQRRQASFDRTALVLQPFLLGFLRAMVRWQLFAKTFAFDLLRVAVEQGSNDLVTKAHDNF